MKKVYTNSSKRFFLPIICIIMYCNSCCNEVTVPETFYFPIIVFAQRACIHTSFSLLSPWFHCSQICIHFLPCTHVHKAFIIHHSLIFTIHNAFTYRSKRVYLVFISLHCLSELPVLRSKLIHHSIFLKITSFKLF